MTAAEWISIGVPVTVAVLAGLVTIVASYRTTKATLKGFKIQAKLKQDELTTQISLKEKELENLVSKLHIEREAVRQTQLTEVVRKRIDVYPQLYGLIATYGRNWLVSERPFDQEWVKEFLDKLLQYYANNGALFSDDVYSWYGPLRDVLVYLRSALQNGRSANENEIELMFAIIRGPHVELPPSGHQVQSPGLGTHIKNELGSYITATVSATFADPDPYLTDYQKGARYINERGLSHIGTKLQQLLVTDDADQ